MVTLLVVGEVFFRFFNRNFRKMFFLFNNIIFGYFFLRNIVKIKFCVNILYNLEFREDRKRVGVLGVKRNFRGRCFMFWGEI